jgi:S1-C subfamily serine protease
MAKPSQVKYVLSVAAAAALLVSACGGTSDEGTPKETNPEEVSTPCSPGTDESPSKALIRCGATSLAFIETPFATGSGVAVEVDGEDYVVTNLHVTYPFDRVTASISGAGVLEELPVVGVDIAADIAVLGPVEGSDEVTPVPLTGTTVESGDDVFLIGYPQADDVEQAELTVTSGLVSRERTSEEWDQTYIQSDALIAEGQSGGGLFDAEGRLVGISSIVDDQGFSFSLASRNVQEATKDVLAEGGDELLQAPPTVVDAEGGATAGVVSLPDDLEMPTLMLPMSEEPRTWNLSVTGPEGAYAVVVEDALTFEPLAFSQLGVDLYNQTMTALGEEPITLSPEVAEHEVAPGKFVIDVPPGVTPEVVLTVAGDVTPTSISWTSDQPLWTLVEDAPSSPLQLDQTAEGTISGYRSGVPYTVDLQAGQKVELSATSPQGDLALAIAKPGTPLDASSLDEALAALSGEGGSLGTGDDPVVCFDDSGQGLCGLDVVEEYTAEQTGTYSLWVSNLWDSPVAYHLTVGLLGN